MVRKTFMHVMTLIQNSSTKEQLDLYLEHAYNLFMNQNLDGTVYFSLDLLSNDIMINKCGYFEEQTNKDNQHTSKTETNYIDEACLVFGNDYEESIKNSSPFKSYYNNVFQNQANILNQKQELDKSQNYLPNEFFCPELFEILHDKLYLIPLWTGLLLDNNKKIQYDVKTRLSNNPVENWFNMVKNFLLRNRRVFTSEFVGISYKRLMSKYFQHYAGQKDLEQTFKGSFEEQTENWKSKKGNRKIKGSYYKSLDIYKLETLYNYETIKEMSLKHHFDSLLACSKIERMDTNDNENKKNEEMSTNDGNEEMDITSISQHYDTAFIDYIQNQFYQHIQGAVNIEQIKSKFRENELKFEQIIKILREEIEKDRYLCEQDQIDSIYINALGLQDTNLFPVYSSADGNCLYNSISTIVFGDQNYYKLIKVISIYIVLKYEDFFKEIMDDDSKFSLSGYKFNEFVLKTCRDKEWGNEMNILSICLVFKSVIYSYNKANPQSNALVRVKFCQFELSNEKKKLILIGFFQNHFFPILIGNQTSNLELKKK